MYVQTNVCHLRKPKEVLGDGGGAALDLHQRDLFFRRHQDVFLVVEHSCQVHAPNETNMKQSTLRENNTESVTLVMSQSHRLPSLSQPDIGSNIVRNFRIIAVSRSLSAEDPLCAVIDLFMNLPH